MMLPLSRCGIFALNGDRVRQTYAGRELRFAVWRDGHACAIAYLAPGVLSNLHGSIAEMVIDDRIAQAIECFAHLRVIDGGRAILRGLP